MEKLYDAAYVVTRVYGAYLREKINKFEKEVEKQISLLKKNPKKRKFIINNVSISLVDLTLLLYHYKSKKPFYGALFPCGACPDARSALISAKKRLIERENFLLKIPGFTIYDMHTPEKVDDWMNNLK